ASAQEAWLLPAALWKGVAGMIRGRNLCPCSQFYHLECESSPAGRGAERPKSPRPPMSKIDYPRSGQAGGQPRAEVRGQIGQPEPGICGIGEALRARYDEIVRQPVPWRLAEALERLDVRRAAPR